MEKREIQWISIEKVLPTTNEIVMVYGNGKGGCARYDNGKWIDYDGEIHYWHPITKPEISKEEFDIIVDAFIGGEMQLTLGDFTEITWKYFEYVFRRRRKETIYLQHKTASYKNGKRKLGFYFDGHVIELVPKKESTSGGISYSFDWGDAKEMDSETLNKHYKEISRSDYFFLEIENIPTNY